MFRRRLIQLGIVFCALAAHASSLRADEAPIDLSIEPADFQLRGAAAKQQVIVTGTRDGRRVDLTREVEFQSETLEVVHVDAAGLVTPVAEGRGVVVARVGEQVVKATVSVTGAKLVTPVSFELDVQPILTARGCNQGACHGKARGQNGFQLSLFGFDPDADFEALTQNARGRRVFPAAGSRSLLLAKATAQLPHGGGRPIELGSEPYQKLLRWIEAGTPRRIDDEPKLSRVTVTPSARFMRPGEQQQLVVTAYYDDDTSRDVTRLTRFQSSESAVVAIDRHGLVTAGTLPGEAAMMAVFMGKIAICRVAIPLPGEVPAELYAELPRANFIDELVWQKLQSMGITPSPPVDDAKYMRRVFIDLIGRLPTPDEIRTFLADTAPDRRARLVDAVLERPEYADHWANKWADLLRPNPYRVGIKAVINYDHWIRDSFRKNKPYDQFVRELVIARGTTWRNGAVTLFRDRRTPPEVTPLVSQLFLGVRLECAKCHQHPFEVWGQREFYGFAAYFARVGHRGRLSPPISGDEEKIFTAAADPQQRRNVVRHPLTDEVLAPRPLIGEAPEIDPARDPREALFEWMVSEDNPFFAKVMVNRVWADLMGRGIVDPVDDLRTTNPPTNGPLLDALADEFRRVKFDLKELLRTITASEVYRLSSEVNDRNVADTRYHSRYYRQRLRAEVLLDAISDVTEVKPNFAAMPPGSRASEIWTRRVTSLFLDTFGRPDPNQDPPCERTSDTTTTQTLHLMNAPSLHAGVISDSGRAARLAAGDRSPADLVEELYLLLYNRFPDGDERQIGESLFAKEGIDRRQATEDLMWALINTPEFLFKD